MISKNQFKFRASGHECNHHPFITSTVQRLCCVLFTMNLSPRVKLPSCTVTYEVTKLQTLDSVSNLLLLLTTIYYDCALQGLAV